MTDQQGSEVKEKKSKRKRKKRVFATKRDKVLYEVKILDHHYSCRMDNSLNDLL